MFFNYDYSNAEVTDKQIKTNEDFLWTIDVPLTGKIIIDIEFLDLKVLSQDVSVFLIHFRDIT